MSALLLPGRPPWIQARRMSAGDETYQVHSRLAQSRSHASRESFPIFLRAFSFSTPLSSSLSLLSFHLTLPFGISPSGPLTSVTPFEISIHRSSSSSSLPSATVLNVLQRFDVHSFRRIVKHVDLTSIYSFSGLGLVLLDLHLPIRWITVNFDRSLYG